MSVRKKLFIFVVSFSSIFWLFRTIDRGKLLFVDLSELSGLPWLYSSIGLIFSILAAFTVYGLFGCFTSGPYMPEKKVKCQKSHGQENRHMFNPRNILFYYLKTVTSHISRPDH